MEGAQVDLVEERIELERGTTGLGFNIKGGRDQPHVPRDSGIFVTKIRDDGAAAKDGSLQKGDKILEVQYRLGNGVFALSCYWYLCDS